MRRIEHLSWWRLFLLNAGLRLVEVAERCDEVGDDFVARIRLRWQAPPSPRATEER